jgi:hypothetical protein
VEYRVWHYWKNYVMSTISLQNDLPSIEVSWSRADRLGQNLLVTGQQNTALAVYYSWFAKPFFT